MYQVIEKRMLNSSVTLLSFAAPAVAKKAQPGQFVILRIDQKGERIPLTIADYDPDKGSVTVIVQTVGYSTTLLASLEAGQAISDLVGPLGQPSHLDGVKRAAVVGGGVGCAIAYPQAKYLHEHGAVVDLIAGFRNKDIVILEDEMAAACTNFYLTTDDGSYREKGFVTDKLKALLEAKNQYDMVIAIGPVPMMRAVCNTTLPFGVKTIVSLNPIMIDGTGMCGGCRVTVDGKTRFACVDGPDFDGHKVDFNELMQRNSAYREQESNMKEHGCRLYGGNENA